MRFVLEFFFGFAFNKRDSWEQDYSLMSYWYKQNDAILRKYRKWGTDLVDTLLKERTEGTDRGKSLMFAGHNHLSDNYEQTLSHLLPVSCLPIGNSDKIALGQEDLTRFRSQIWANAYAQLNLRFVWYFFWVCV